MSHRGLPTQALTGAVVVAIGVLLLLGTTGIYDIGGLWRYVPSLFVLLGLWAVYRSGFRNLAGPAVLVLVAGTVQLLALGFLTAADVAAWWPLLVVVFGLSLLAGHWRGRRRVPGVATADVDLLGIFGGTQRRVTSAAFRGGSVTAVFGGVDLDLRAAGVDDPPAAITATALFGGVEIDVPDDWVVEIDALPIFGAVEDDRIRLPPEAGDAGEPDLVVTGVVAFGGISVT
jgi:predicted membrane protein